MLQGVPPWKWGARKSGFAAGLYWVFIKRADTEGPKNTEKERAKGAAATGLCKRSGFVALSTIGVARDILGSQAPPIIRYSHLSFAYEDEMCGIAVCWICKERI